MFKQPIDYACLLLEGFNFDRDEAILGLFTAAKTHPNVPAKFWRDVLMILWHS